jgi:hypothetical protein
VEPSNNSEDLTKISILASTSMLPVSSALSKPRPNQTKPKVATESRISSYNSTLAARETQTRQRLENIKLTLYEKEMQECTFRPQITNNAAKLAVKYNNYVEKLLETITASNGANEDVNDQVDGNNSLAEENENENEMNSIQSEGDNMSQSSRSLAALPAYERLYKQKDKLPLSVVREKHRTREEVELDGVTFTPNIEKSFYHKYVTEVTNNENSMVQSKSIIPFGGSNKISQPKSKNNMATLQSRYHRRRSLGEESDLGFDFNDNYMDDDNFRDTPGQGGSSDMSTPDMSTTVPKGFEETVRRMREATENKIKKERFETEYFQTNEEKYALSRQRAQEGPKPFRFRTEERKMEKEKAIAQISSPDATIANAENSIRSPLTTGMKRIPKLNNTIHPIRYDTFSGLTH